MNTVILIGNHAKDPELRYTQSGKAVCNFSIAVNRGFGKDNDADFIQCVAWEKTAEAIANYMEKGSKMAVQGRLQVSSYEKDGQTRYKTEVVAQQVQFLGKAKQDSRPNQQQEEKEQKQEDWEPYKPKKEQIDIKDFQTMNDDEDFSDDLPF